jgi:hypothetical protein
MDYKKNPRGFTEAEAESWGDQELVAACHRILRGNKTVTITIEGVPKQGSDTQENDPKKIIFHVS